METIDCRLEITDEGADLVLEGGDLRAEHGLRTAVLVSIFTDKRVPEGTLLPEEGGSRGGWWGDLGDPWGSTLWLERRGKATAATRDRVRLAIEDAHRWLLEEGIASAVSVEAALQDEAIGFLVKLTRGDARQWPELWAATQADPGDKPGDLVTLDLV